MSKNHFASLRYSLIDKCFQSSMHQPSTSDNPDYAGYWSVNDLINKIYESIGIEISKRTLEYDFDNLRADYNAPIVNMKGIGYKYEYKFSITNNPLTDNDYQILGEITGILKHYRGFKYFDDVDTIISKIESNQSEKGFAKIQLDTISAYSGLDYIAILKKAIYNKTVLELTYSSFNSLESTVKFHPYILKEFNNRWFVLGYVNKQRNRYGRLQIFALDRIKEISDTPLKYNKPPKDLVNYFKNIYGVTNDENESLEIVRLKLNPYRSNYLRTKPIHASQVIVEENKDFDIYEFKLKINNEITSWILSHSNDMEVLAPDRLRKMIKSRLTAALGLYEK